MDGQEVVGRLNARRLAMMLIFRRTAERIGTYANLKTTEDMGDSRYQRMLGRYEHVATMAAEASCPDSPVPFVPVLGAVSSSSNSASRAR